jgi:RNA polymerase sigma factor (sigma-70 family)
MDPEGQLRDDFAAFYRAHLDMVLSFCFARTRDAELSADIAAEVFAAALQARGGYRADSGSPRQWLLGIAAHKTADAQRAGHAEHRARQALGIVEITWTEDDLNHVLDVGHRPAAELLETLPRQQRDAVRARVLHERGYPDIARGAGVSEQLVRQRVSRGLATLRRRLAKEAR